MTRFDIIDHTADAGIVAYGNDLREAFANAAYGMFSLVAELNGIGEGSCHEVNVEATDQEALLVAWLNELLYLFDVERVIFHRFDIIELENNRLQAKAYGEKIDKSRHLLKTEVKAATYHSLKIEKENGFRIQVILDM
ncbi:MAG TPA: archease [Dehalococcoidia bacterium]|nr:archease [Dehalococcoidia bacterium]